MTQTILDFAHGLITSPWIYLLVFGIALLDGFFPVVPSETLVITTGAFAASTGEPDALLILPVAALGAILGDHVSYWLGRRAGGTRRIKDGKAFRWARKEVTERGGLILVVARYIPGGRTATTLTLGATRYPFRRFFLFDVLAGTSWAVYSVLVGYIGGVAFEEDPFKGLLLGLGIAIGITAVVELVRYARKRRNASPQREAEKEKAAV
ncbi:DedA family protein [Actinocorallia populi]|uniref:DedA family protein n=1 Tax=Actinocorallia populi TaxID=2079200 RepID=UPI000D09003C|nr:DedA family protein [Actinocorallia populi]